MSNTDAEAVERFLSLQKPDESDSDFAERMGIAPQVLSSYKNRHHSLSLKSALRIHEHADVSLDWLLAGKGAPRATGEEPGESFDDGGRFVLRRLLRSVLEVLGGVRQAGIVSADEAGAIRAPIESYLEDSEQGR